MAQSPLPNKNNIWHEANALKTLEKTPEGKNFLLRLEVEMEQESQEMLTALAGMLGYLSTLHLLSDTLETCKL